MDLSTLFPNINRSTGEKFSGEIGTPERPIYLPDRVPTGANARRSLQDRAIRQAKTEDPDVFLPVSARERRRAAEAADRRQSKKGRRAFVRREWAKEREANQLAQLFNIVDKLVPTSPLAQNRARQAISARVKYLRDVQQREYDRQIAARQENRDLPAPKKIQSHEEIEVQLRGLAKTAATRIPKAARRRQALDDFFARELVRDQRALDAGRTGRAG